MTLTPDGWRFDPAPYFDRPRPNPEESIFHRNRALRCMLKGAGIGAAIGVVGGVTYVLINNNQDSPEVPEPLVAGLVAMFGAVYGGGIGAVIGLFYGMATQDSPLTGPALAPVPPIESPQDNERDLARQARVAPDDVQVWEDLGDAEVRVGDLPDALKSYQWALHLSPKDVNLKFKIEALQSPAH